MKIFNFFKNRTKQEDPIHPRRYIGLSGGTLVSDDTCMEASAFYRGVIYVSTQIAKLPWEVKDKDYNILDNDISYLLNVSPNPETTSFHLKLFLLQCAMIVGNGYAEIERTNDGRVKALWPLNPKKVCAYRTVEGTLYYEVAGGGPNGENVLIPPRNIFIVRNFHTKDSISGQGIVAYAMNTLGISLGADKFANSLYSNGGLPSGVLKIKGTLTDEAFKRLKEDWKDSYGGRKTGQTAILEEGTEYSPISHSPDVLQFLESRKFGVIEIARFLGVPPTKLFDSDAAKFNNIEHANLEVATDTLDAWARNLESEADMKLLAGSKNGRYTELDLYAVFRGDMNTRSQYFQRMMQSGAITPNEIRKSEGRAPYSGGDRYYISTNNFTPSDMVDELLESQISKNKEPQGQNKESKTDPKEDDEVSKALVNFLEMKTGSRN